METEARLAFENEKKEIREEIDRRQLQFFDEQRTVKNRIIDVEVDTKRIRCDIERVIELQQKESQVCNDKLQDMQLELKQIES